MKQLRIVPVAAILPVRKRKTTFQKPMNPCYRAGTSAERVIHFTNSAAAILCPLALGCT